MRDVDERDADLVLDALQLELHLLAQLQVERAERLVEQQHARMVDERPRERDALLLAARELARLPLLEQAEPDELERVAHALLQLAAAQLLAAQPEGDVLEDREVREERVRLEHGVDVALVRRQRRRRPRRRARCGPSVGSSKPPIMRSVVVLPQPDGPSSAKKRPCSISSDRLSTATTSPKRFVRFVSRMSATLISLPCLGQHLAERAGDLVELLLGRDQRRRDLDDRIAAVVGPADQAFLEERRREEAAQQRLALLVVERLARLLVLHELERVEEARAADVADDRQVEQLLERRAERVARCRARSRRSARAS